MSVTLVVEQLTLPAIVIHGGAGAYVKTTTVERRKKRGEKLASVCRDARATFAEGGPRAAVIDAIRALERDPSFNAGYGARLQQDGEARLSAALMDGRRTRMSAVYNVKACKHPSELALALQDRSDRNLDGEGARLLMEELEVPFEEVRNPRGIERWKKLVQSGDKADREGAIGNAGQEDLAAAKEARIPIPEELENKYGTVGAVACDTQGDIWACTSTGGRGHESVGRVSDSPTPAGNYATPLVAISATGFGEQILDLNVCGRIATRMQDGATLEEALSRTFDEVERFDGLLGVIAIARDGTAGYAHTTEACGVAWLDAAENLHIDRHGR
jgi:L-asparaginase